MSMNPRVLTQWIFGACVGYLVGGDLYTAVAGLAVATGITVVIDLYE